MSGKPIATIGSNHTCPMCTGLVVHVGGPVIGAGAPNVLANGKPVALMGDLCVCAGGPDTIVEGHPFIKINGVPLATVGSATAHGGIIVMGESNILISSSVPSAPVTMAKEKIPFPKITFNSRIKAAVIGHSLVEAEQNQQKIKANAKETEVPEDSELTIDPTLPQELVHLLAKEHNFEHFLTFMLDVYGKDIPTQAYHKLYEAALDKSPDFIVTYKVKKTIPKKAYACFYDNKRDIREIWVKEDFLREAAKNNDKSGELMVALIEEFGHWIDYLLRNVYADTKSKDALRDEGAYFSNKMILLNSLENSSQDYANATIDGTSHDLVWDYTLFHKALSDYVSEERWYKDDNFGNFEFYKEGFGDVETGEYAHGSIERIALAPLFVKHLSELPGLECFKSEDEINDYLLKIYFGNWKRDNSQGLDPQATRILANGLISAFKSDKLGDPNYKGIEMRTSMDYMKSHLPTKEEREIDFKRKIYLLKKSKLIRLKTIDWEFNAIEKVGSIITKFLQMTAVKKFVYPLYHKEYVDGKKQVMNDKGANYKTYLDRFYKEYTPVNVENMGVYVPAEHIDNPKELGREMAKYDGKGKFIGHCPNDDQELLPLFMGKDLNDETLDQININYGMKNYIRQTNISSEPEFNRYKYSFDYMMYKFKEAACVGGYKNKQCQDSLGAALHTLEDFFAHSNFAELALIKKGFTEVFPMVGYIGHAKDATKKNIKKKKFEKSDDTYELNVYEDTVKEYSGDPQGLNYMSALDYYYYSRPNTAEDQRKIDFLKNDNSIIVCDTIGINFHNEIVTRIPLVTGKFGLFDTLVSVLPLINGVFDSDDLNEKDDNTDSEENKGVRRAPRRTYSDILILELLRAITNKDEEIKLAKESKPLSKEESELLKVTFNYPFTEEVNYQNLKTLENHKSPTEKNPQAVEDSSIVKSYLNCLAKRDFLERICPKTMAKAEKNTKKLVKLGLKKSMKSLLKPLLHTLYTNAYNILQVVQKQLESKEAIFLDDVIDIRKQAIQVYKDLEKSGSIKPSTKEIIESKEPFCKDNLSVINLIINKSTDPKKVIEYRCIRKDLLKSFHNKLLKGFNPSHTQVAKDDSHHCMHELSAKLAIRAVGDVSDVVFRIWAGDKEAKYEDILNVVGNIFRHPAQTDWQDRIVTEWVTDEANKDKLTQSTNLIAIINSLEHFLEEVGKSISGLEKLTKKIAFRRIDDSISKLDESGDLKGVANNFMSLFKEVKGLYTEYDKSIKSVSKELRSLYPQKEYTTEEIGDRINSVDVNTFQNNMVRPYTVQEGDSLSSIAKYHKTTIERLFELNVYNSNRDNLNKISRKEHKIKKGDILSVPMRCYIGKHLIVSQ